MAEGSVGGFLNSSRNFAGSPANYSGANCKIVWFLKSYGPQNLGENNSNVYAAIFTKKPVRKGDALVWDYPWKYCSVQRLLQPLSDRRRGLHRSGPPRGRDAPDAVSRR